MLSRYLVEINECIQQHHVPFVTLLGTCVVRGSITDECGLDYVKPFETKKQHGFVYIMMIKQSLLSQLFSSY